MTIVTTRAHWDAQNVPLQQARPRLFDSDQIVDLYIGRRPRRSVWQRLGSTWSRCTAASWWDSFLIALWLGLLLAGARVGGLL